MVTDMLAYRLIDADNHYYEPDDCYTRHIEAKFRGRVINVDRTEPGVGRVRFGEEPVTRRPAMLIDAIGRPGSMRAFLEGRDESRFPIQTINAHDVPAFMNRLSRLSVMDEQGLEAAILLPTLGVLVEQEMQHDVEALQANLRSF